MKRDGDKKSIWQVDIENYAPVNGWEKDKTYDVLIVGGGITGLTAALLLQKEGKKCILAEAHNLGFGTTGGSSAHLNTILDSTYDEIEKKFGKENARHVATDTREAMDLIEGLVNAHHIECDFAYRTAYLLANTEQESNSLEKIKEASEQAGIMVNEAASVPLPLPYTKALRFEFQAQFHPVKYLHGLARAFEENGGIILQNCHVNSVEYNQQFTADTSLGNIYSSTIVYATHIPPGLNILHMRCAPYRSYVAAFRLKSGAYPDALAYDMQDPYHYFRTHKIEGKDYLIVGGFDHKTGHNNNTEYIFTELEAYVRQYYDVDTADYKWSSQYYIPADGLPYIGLMPGEDNIYVATGFNGNGLILGSLAAKLICTLIFGKEHYGQSLYNPSRIKPIAGFSSFVKENADAVSMFISKRLSYDKISELAELAPGEAVVAEWEGYKVALYKDENGGIHALDPVCPHAKCIVTWNNAEKSWDCPCHGARYAPNGDLLTGPARHGLTQIKWEGIDGD
ncbi:MAG: FAD-dependent oxidoreductase [Bacteroidetes bacterium]|nr:FAD-dependent oxidoreductase [Bacteroidota bacterium]